MTAPLAQLAPHLPQGIQLFVLRLTSCWGRCIFVFYAFDTKDKEAAEQGRYFFINTVVYCEGRSFVIISEKKQ